MATSVHLRALWLPIALSDVGIGLRDPIGRQFLEENITSCTIFVKWVLYGLTYVFASTINATLVPRQHFEVQSKHRYAAKAS